ncbi:MAG: Uncharacterized protein XD81_0438 [Bacteroidetes bacterium 38_7]|nr:MAG: Uncharacterized protein XD81_0438 [Bacteroidetes bacterium 38_7]
MRILLVTATWLEAKPLMDGFSFLRKYSGNNYSFRYGDHRIDVLVTGMGMVATAFGVGKALQNTQYNLVLDAGICSSFRKEFSPGTVLNVNEEFFPEFGMSDDAGFKYLQDMGFDTSLPTACKNTILQNPHFNQVMGFKNLATVRGATVNLVNLTERRPNTYHSNIEADIETQEGGAFFFSCLASEVPFIELRAVSNYIGPPDEEGWDIEKAIQNLTFSVHEALNVLPR